jgi:ribosomal protein S18
MFDYNDDTNSVTLEVNGVTYSFPCDEEEVDTLDLEWCDGELSIEYSAYARYSKEIVLPEMVELEKEIEEYNSKGFTFVVKKFFLSSGRGRPEEEFNTYVVSDIESENTKEVNFKNGETLHYYTCREGKIDSYSRSPRSYRQERIDYLGMNMFDEVTKLWLADHG